MVIRYRKPTVIILDIDGTTTPLSFYKDVVIPYTKDNLKDFLRSRWGHVEVKATVEMMRMQAIVDRKRGAPSIPEDRTHREDIIDAVKESFIWQLTNKSYSDAYKQLQVLMMMDGFANRAIRGQIFEDVSAAFHVWAKRQHIRVYLFSSGMIAAQQLQFTCTTKGNLTPLISGYFDCGTIGVKTEPSSFRKICIKLNEKSEDIVFFTDNPNEARAAAHAGCSAFLVARPGNRPFTIQDKEEFQVIRSFDEIEFED